MTIKQIVAQERKAEKLLGKLDEMRKYFDKADGFEDVWDKIDGAYHLLDWAIEYMYSHEEKMEDNK